MEVNPKSIEISLNYILRTNPLQNYSILQYKLINKRFLVLNNFEVYFSIYTLSANLICESSLLIILSKNCINIY